MKDSFVLYSNYEDKFKLLSDKDKGKLIMAIFAFVRGEDLSDTLSPSVLMAYAFITQQIAIDIAKYKEICDRRRENGQLGGRPRKNTSPNDENEKANGFKENQMVFEKSKQKHNDNEYDNDNVYLEENTLKSVKEDETSSFSTRTQKHKYGKYKNVLLTEEEFRILSSEPDGLEAIEFFSEYREIKGYKCKNDNLAIRKWAFNAVKEQREREARGNKQQSQTLLKRESPMEQLSRVLEGS